MSSDEKVLITKEKLDNLSIAVQNATGSGNPGLTIDEMTSQIKSSVSGGAQSDWEENNAESASYIKNRPFYKTSLVSDFPIIDYDTAAPDYSYNYEEDGNTIPISIFKLNTTTPIDFDEFIIGREVVFSYLTATNVEKTRKWILGKSHDSSDQELYLDPEGGGIVFHGFFAIFSSIGLDDILGISGSGIILPPGYYYGFFTVDGEKAPIVGESSKEEGVIKIKNIELITQYNKIPIEYLPLEDYNTKKENDKIYATKNDINKFDSFSNFHLFLGKDKTNYDSFFEGSYQAKTFPYIDLQYATSAKSLFSGCQDLTNLGFYFGSSLSDESNYNGYTSVENITEADGLQGAFAACYALEEIYLFNINANIDLMNSSKLKDSSVYYLAFFGLNEVSENRTITLHSLTPVTAEELAEIQRKGWTLVGGNITN